MKGRRARRPSIAECLAVLLAAALLSTACLGSADAQSRTARGGLNRLSSIGLGAADFLADLEQRGTCRNGTERLAAESAQDALATFGTVAGGLAGGLLGDDLLGSNAAGGLLGGFVGRYWGRRIGSDLAPVAADAVRTDSETFEFHVCRMIAASDMLKGPLVSRYLQIAEHGCSFERSRVAAMENSDWNNLVDCNNRGSGEAREIVLQIIRINQAVCFSIDALGSALTGSPADTVRGIRPGNSVSGDCDARSPAAVWQSYLADRM